MQLARFATQRPVTMLMLLVSIVVLGVVALSRLPLLFLPSFDSPRLSVVVPYPSSAPEEIARLIVEPIEAAMGTVSHIERIVSQATATEGRVRLEFVNGADMELAAVEVRDRLDRVRGQLPDDVEHVFLRRFSNTDIPVMAFRVTWQGSQEALEEIIDHTLQRRLQALDGVADVRVFGLQRKTVQLQIDPERLESHGLTTYQLSGLLRRNHIALSGGALEDGGVRYLLRSIGEFSTPEQIADLPLNGQGLQLRDIAQVRNAYPDKTRFDRLDREEAVTIAIYRTSTANDVDVARSVHRTLDVIQALPGLQALSLFVYFDSSRNILKRLYHLRNTGLIGGALALLILFLFLRHLRPTVVLGIAIPISVMATFLIMYLLREGLGSPISLNVVTFSGLMLSVGMLVDSSVVVLENIVRHRQLGKSAREASVVGASEVSKAVVVATATSIVVFLPTIFVGQGFMGRILSEFGLVLCAALVASLVVSLSGIPLLSTHLIAPLRERPERLQSGVNRAYGNAIVWTLRHRWWVVLAAIIMFGVSLYLFIVVLLPNRDDTRVPRRDMYIRVKTDHSVPFAKVAATMADIEDILLRQREQLEIRHVSTSFSESGEHNLRVFFRELDESRTPTDKLQEQLLAVLPERAGIEYRVARGRGAGGREIGITVQIQGPNGDVLAHMAQTVENQLKGLEGVYNVETDVDRDDDELRLEVDRQQAQRMGLHPQRVAATVALAMSQRPVTTLTLDDREVDITMHVGDKQQLDAEQLDRLPVAVRNRRLATHVGNLANQHVQRALTHVTLEDRVRTTSVTVYTQDRQSLSEIVRNIYRRMGRLNFPKGYTWQLGNSYRRFAESERDATFTLGVAIALIYIIMAALFESIVMPLAIMLTVPFALSGVVLVFTITGTNLNQMADLGLLILCGLVVNNGIILVDATNQLRARGVSRVEALIRSGQQRLRPILMTVITTVAGLTPMVAPLFFPSFFGPPERYVAIYGPIGLVVIGGLLTSTLLTLFLLPPVYALLDQGSAIVRQGRRRLQD
ncbi:MAG: hypothetical protein ETSY2_29370 [Candidatus Entotheonella gemina]|uniref:Acriflavin resistance protein n=2 Tax=Candidatus Entotheonella TaxID=93171 RepID=W4M1Z0_9BACT|nr:MAG: hypothetical protein ETSY2_29370 [Candidatus Entotheonella gemina]